MRSLPKFLATLFIAVTVQRVAGFAGGGTLAWLFALGLTVGVFVPAYFIRYVALRKRAWAVLILFAAADGLFNLSHAYEAAVNSGRWSVPIHAVATVVFGLFPTLAAAMLGWLSAGIDQLPSGPKRKLSVQAALKARIIEIVAGEEWLEAEGRPAKEGAQRAAPLPALGNEPVLLEATARSLSCPQCGVTAGSSGKPFRNQQALNAHMRKHKRFQPAVAATGKWSEQDIRGLTTS